MIGCRCTTCIPRPSSPAPDDRRLHRALAALRDDGVRIGVSTSGSAQADAVRRAVAVTVDQVAIAAALAQPWARRVLSGAVTVAQLRANLDSAAVRLGPDEVAGLTSRPEPPEQYWSQRSSRAWT